VSSDEVVDMGRMRACGRTPCAYGGKDLVCRRGAAGVEAVADLRLSEDSGHDAGEADR
jgi:hypothetical protein